SKIGLINKIPLTNSFNYLITKKRLIMMTKQVNKTRTLFKKIALLPLLSLLVFFFSTKVVAVLPTSAQQFTSVEISPQFPGGMDEFRKFIMGNIISPPTISGTTKVTFYIDKDGTVKIPASSRESEGINKNAIIAVLAKSPKWHPAVQNGNFTKVSYV